VRQQPRKHLAPPGITQPKPRDVSKLAGKYHAHGCQQCSARYCDNCHTPHLNDRCRNCNGAMYGRSTWDIGGDPEDCCRRHSVPATTEQMQIHNCAGDGPWWLCKLCHRTHPYNPTTHQTPTGRTE
jgi:hypothetical protein